MSVVFSWGCRFCYSFAAFWFEAQNVSSIHAMSVAARPLGPVRALGRSQEPLMALHPSQAHCLNALAQIHFSNSEVFLSELSCSSYFIFHHSNLSNVMYAPMQSKLTGVDVLCVSLGSWILAGMWISRHLLNAVHNPSPRAGLFRVQKRFKNKQVKTFQSELVCAKPNMLTT